MSNWFIIANEETAIIAEEDGTLVVMPTPVLREQQRQRDAVETGSEKGKKTFKPGSGLDLLLSLASEGPVQVHTELPDALRDELARLLNQAWIDAELGIAQLLEDNLTPKQKEELSADEESTGDHTDD